MTRRQPTAAALATLASAGLAGCLADEPAPTDSDDPNAGLLRDFVDGKFDAAGRPLNARAVSVAQACPDRAEDAACLFPVPAGVSQGRLVGNVRLRLTTTRPAAASAEQPLVRVVALGQGDAELAAETLTWARLRAVDDWVDLAVRTDGRAGLVAIRVEPTPGIGVRFDEVELFPERFGLVVGPGAGPVRDADRLTIELPEGRALDALSADGVDLRPRLTQLLADGEATRIDTGFRTVIDVGVGALLPERADVTELHLASGDDAARTQLRRAPAPCAYEGDPTGVRVLLTGFQPFPADGWHPNISAEAVGALDPATLDGAQVMRLILPVEYDRAPAAVADVIDRCAPDAVISFGQGGSAIALEEVGYNLQDTGELVGGVPDNRGIIRAAAPIDPAGPPRRDATLPLGDIAVALRALGESARESQNPGRYICNNTLYVVAGAMAGRGPAGFIHLPYTTRFDDESRARWGAVVAAAVDATVASLR